MKFAKIAVVALTGVLFAACAKEETTTRQKQPGLEVSSGDAEKDALMLEGIGKQTDSDRLELEQLFADAEADGKTDEPTLGETSETALALQEVVPGFWCRRYPAGCVDVMYKHYLGRSAFADPGSAGWAGAIVAGVPPIQVAAGIMCSPEAKGRGWCP